MLFADTKAGHLLHILGTALAGQMLAQELVPANPHDVELYGHLVIQVLVAAVTIWATVRKALQRPEAVVKVPVAELPAVLTEGVEGVGSGTGTGQVAANVPPTVKKN